MNRSIAIIVIILSTFGYIKFLNHQLTKVKVQLNEIKSELSQLKQTNKVNQGAMKSLVTGNNVTLDQFKNSLASCNGLLKSEQNRNGAINVEVSRNVMEIQRLKRQIKKYQHPCTDTIVPDGLYE